MGLIILKIFQEDSMKLKKALLIFAISVCSYAIYANMPEGQTVQKDNTALNKSETVTAETQSRGSEADIEITRRLREKIMSDNQLSTNAKNIKIITVGDVITLSGPVSNKAEKQKIENMAHKMDRTKKIHSRLTY